MPIKALTRSALNRNVAVLYVALVVIRFEFDVTLGWATHRSRTGVNPLISSAKLV